MSVVLRLQFSMQLGLCAMSRAQMRGCSHKRRNNLAMGEAADGLGWIRLRDAVGGRRSNWRAVDAAVATSAHAVGGDRRRATWRCRCAAKLRPAPREIQTWPQ